MTDVIGRPASDEATTTLEVMVPVELPEDVGLPRPEGTAAPVGGLTGPERWALGAFSAAAGLIHVAMAPSHLDTGWLEGTGFLVAAWIQLGLAVGLVLRPARWMLALTVVANAAFVAVWAVSRTAGLPFGSHASHPEAVSAVDGAAVALEMLLIGLALLALRGVRVLRADGGAFAAVVPVAALALATAVIASPDASNHAAHSHGDHMAATSDDKGLSLLVNGHQHSNAQVELDPRTQAELTAQLLPTMDLVEKYPTVAAAEAAGYERSGPFSPGVGAHYRKTIDFEIDADGTMHPDDIDDAVLVFDGTEPESPLAGFMFYVGGDSVPEGFVGPNDNWHWHDNVCIVTRDDGRIDTPFLADMDGVTKQMCTDIGGEWLAQTGYMVHAWTVPGYESGRGVFSEINPKVTCPDGTYYKIPADQVGARLTTCRGG